MWAGLGGYNSPRLSQDGFSAGAPNDSYPWWELLDQAHSNPEVKFTGQVLEHPTPGHIVDAYTGYVGGGFSFFVEDLTTGISWSTYISSYKGDPASAYYEGTTSDFITEAPSGGNEPGGLYSLRKPTAPVHFTYAVTNSHALNYYNSWRINEVGYTGNLMQSTSFDGIHNWYNTWHNCK